MNSLTKGLSFFPFGSMSSTQRCDVVADTGSCVSKSSGFGRHAVVHSHSPKESKSPTHFPENLVTLQLEFSKCWEACSSIGLKPTSSTWSSEGHAIGFSPVLLSLFVNASFACSSLLFKKSRCETVLLPPSQLVRHVTRLWFVR